MVDIAKKLREYAGKVHHAPATEAMISAADHIDALEEKLTENVKATDDELTRYIAKCREMSTSGLSKQEIKDGKTYSWWSRLAEVLTTLEAQLAERQVKLLDPDMPAQQLRMHLGEMTAQELRTARAAIRFANSALTTLEATPPAPKVTEAQSQQALEFVARWCWRTDPPNASNKLTDAERLSVIKFHPTIKRLGHPHVELADHEAAALSGDAS